MVTTYDLVSGQLKHLSDAASMNAASAQLPQGAYTTFRTYAGDRVLRLEQHLRRLEESVNLLQTGDTLVDDDVRRALGTALRLTGYAESRFRLTFSPPHFFISIESFKAYPAALYEQGVRCMTVTTHRHNPHAKSTAFIASAGDAYKALPSGVHEGLMVDDDGTLLEGLSSNFFALLGSTLHTEQGRALVGVTQSLALEVAQTVLPDLMLSSSGVAYADLPQVRECFITSVSREIVPVVRIDDQTIGAGVPGTVTRRLMAGMRELIVQEARSVL